MPNIQKLYEKHKNNPSIAFVCISMEEENKVADFISKSSFTFPVYTFHDHIPKEFEKKIYSRHIHYFTRGKILITKIGGKNREDPKWEK